VRVRGRRIAISRGSQRLLAFLALQERPVSRVHVAGVLWPELPDERAAANLRSALWRLRRSGAHLVDAVYYCGPATVSESTYTEGVPVDQPTAGSYMGTNSTDGTSASSMTSGMQHFVGYPVYGWYWYVWVGVPYYPSSNDLSTFLQNLQTDIYSGMPVASDAYEVAGGPHLNGHPTDQTIFHYVETAGWWNYNGEDLVYYADSATTLWSSVPPYSWLDAWTFVVILGGRGYIW